MAAEKEITMRSYELDRAQIERAVFHQNQDWEVARAALAQLGNDLEFRVSSALREELEAALRPTPCIHSNPLGTLGVRA